MRQAWQVGMQGARRAEVQKQWADWSIDLTNAARKEVLKRCSVGQEFEEMRLVEQSPLLEQPFLSGLSLQFLQSSH